MSIMFFKVRSLSRAKGDNAIAKAAYVSRSRIIDLQTGKAHDYRRVRGLAHSEIVLPKDQMPEPGSWMTDRARLWNAAEEAETRRNSRVGREYTIALPHELPDEVRIDLARNLARNIADRHGVAVDVEVHRPGRGDERNHHAHLLATTRELDKHGFTRKATIERSTDMRRIIGLPPTASEYRTLRAIWAESANERLRDAGLSARLEPRSRRTLELERQHAATERETPKPTLSVAQRAVNRWTELRLNRGPEDAANALTPRARARDLDHGLEL
jgi:ATP-dependent exoDNAse (exonuclease V) alpha subunit